MVDFLRWPLGSLKGYFLSKPSAPVQSSVALNKYQSDSLGLVDSGYVDRRLDSGQKRGFVDQQLPEFMYQNHLVPSSLAADHFAGDGPTRRERPAKAIQLQPRDASDFKQVYIWQAYDRRTTMPFSQMPTVY